MTPHWHEQNPWRDQITYVPLERLAECVAGGTVRIGIDGPVQPYDAAFVLQRWTQTSEKLDGYILPQPDGRHSIGVRYGAEGSQYYSPHNAHPEKTRALLAEYRK